MVSPNYRLEAVHGANNDIGHLALEQMLDILCDRFYWPSEWCLRFKSKQDKAELYPLLVTYHLQLVNMHFLTIENLIPGLT